MINLRYVFVIIVSFLFVCSQKYALGFENSEVSCNHEQALPEKFHLGMNGVEVDDQGWEWGTCVLHSVVGALNAHLNLTGDERISRGAIWQLLNHLCEASGTCYHQVWRIIPALTEYGYVSLKDHRLLCERHRNLCSPDLLYPFREGESNSRLISNSDYLMGASFYKKKESDQRKRDGGDPRPIPSDIYLQYSQKGIVRQEQFKNISVENEDQLLKLAKKTLYNGYRLSFGLDLFNAEFMGLNYQLRSKTMVDSFVSTDENLKIESKIGSHAMIITGYDDTVCIDVESDSEILRKQCGVFTVRNSFGSDYGDLGDLYVTYKYFMQNAHSFVAIGGRYSGMSGGTCEGVVYDKS